MCSSSCRRLGANWPARVEGARAWLGPDLTDAVIAVGHGDDVEAIGQLVDISERDGDGLLRAAAREFLNRGVYHDAARLERVRREGDGATMRAFLDSGDPRHRAVAAEMEALFLLESPPAFLVKAFEVLSKR